MLASAEARAKELLTEAEREFVKAAGPVPTRHLWEHTLSVANLAAEIAEAEGGDALVARMAALFHDVGKFRDGKYHEDEVVEEDYAAEVARRELRALGADEALVGRVVAALREMYRPSAESPVEARALHDADVLSKTGAYGVATMLVKWASRGLTVSEIVSRKLARELTYAANAERLLSTETGRRMARKRVERELSTLRALVEEVSELRREGLLVDELEYEGFRIYVVRPRKCTCGAPTSVSLEPARTPACEGVKAVVSCPCCGELYDTLYCLSIFE